MDKQEEFRNECRARIATWRKADHRYEWRGHVTIITKADRDAANEHWRQVEKESNDEQKTAHRKPLRYHDHKL